MDISVVSDASPLIYFAKLNALELVARVLGPVGVPPAAYREAVITGQEQGFPDAKRIATAIEQGWLKRLSLESSEKALAEQLQANSRLGPGEAETIACAVHRSLRALLHDRKARKVAAAHGVSTWQPADVLFLALLRRHTTWPVFQDLLRRLAIVSGMGAATYLEREALAAEIAVQLGLKEV